MALPSNVFRKLFNMGIEGTLGSDIQSLSELEQLDLSYNRNLGGPLPQSIGNLKQLVVLSLNSNQFAGEIPASLGRLSNLTWLDLAGNQLTGRLPTSSDEGSGLDQLLNTLHLLLDHNNFTGEIPESIGLVRSLEILRLKDNAFGGTLDMGSNISHQLEMVDFRNNAFTSVTLSSNYNNSIILVGNPVCSNAQLHETEYCHEPQDSGSGSSITDCLHPYEGPIVCRAPSFSDVSRNLAPMANRLASMVNGTPVSFSLQNYFFDGDAYLQVQLTICPSSAKHFTRREILQWFDLSSQSLALSEIYGPCYFDPWQYSFRRSVNRGLIAGIVVGCVAAVLAIAGLGSYALWQKKRAKKAIILQNPFASWGSTGGDAGDAPQLRLARRFSLDELRKCTDDFSKDNEIGSGGYGKACDDLIVSPSLGCSFVYKATLQDGKTAVAIKRSQKGSKQGGVEFKTEIEMLSRVHHKNLVDLVGFCFEKGERMLVYEYISNGTLTENLSGIILSTNIGLSSSSSSSPRKFVELALRCVEDASDDRPTTSEIVKEIETMLKDDKLKGNSASSSSSSSDAGLRQTYDELLLLSREVNSDGVHRSDRYLFSDRSETDACAVLDRGSE
ncbi:leucine-rich repeat receptor-like protein kinase [Musa troglodytarum]|uniref:Leucine-rich repeat receptor-like protein kinase n=2 Tax=Musa troglodytarum TaxID=320322 RepID=A0A9E7I6J4_9LILI|nr:leucine-rich repeat receptor-like protein kinase [Musa troglodytarum]